MRILLIAEEMWNEKTHPNGVLENWFDGFDAEFALVSCSPGEPYNNCCKSYFQVTDSTMAKSLISNKKAGKYFVSDSNDANFCDKVETENKKLYSKIRIFRGEFLRAVREFIWNYGKYDLDKLYKFIDDFNPDIIFTARKATIKILRLEKIVYDHAKVPMVAFSGDSEYSLRHLSFSPFFWIRKLVLRKKLKEMMPNYSTYYLLTQEHKNEYTEIFGDKFKILRKCGNFSDKSIIKTSVNKPIKLVYIGKLYSRRWASLAALAKEIKKINGDETKLVLNIYTLDKVTKKQQKLLHDGKNTFLMGGVAPEKVMDVYANADIALHIEAFDLKNKLMLRLSFSTKIIDCLSSGCALMVIAWNKHSGYTFVKKEDVGIAVDDLDKLSTTLKKITDNPNIILDYSKKAFEYGAQNNTKEHIQNYIKKEFEAIIENDNK